jgi:ATP adenylyltransferase
MDRLWSPWRSVHVTGWDVKSPEEKDRLLERIGESSDDEANLVVWRGRAVFVLMNRYPYNNGHMMIAPYRAVASYEALREDEQIEIATTISRCIRWLGAALAPDGYNVGINLGSAAGAGIAGHLHVHVVPRWAGDSNFMATLADTRVVPEALGETFRKLRAAAAAD